MEVTDPYTNTTTVKNILQHIIVPKIVSDGSTGYVTRTDLVNVNNIIFSGFSSGVGSDAVPNTSQSGVFLTETKETPVRHSRVTTNSVIIACTHGESSGRHVSHVIPQNGQFVVALALVPQGGGVRVGWFIAHF